jgi:hypothetical protein
MDKRPRVKAATRAKVAINHALPTAASADATAAILSFRSLRTPSANTTHRAGIDVSCAASAFRRVVTPELAEVRTSPMTGQTNAAINTVVQSHRRGRPRKAAMRSMAVPASPQSPVIASA